MLVHGWALTNAPMVFKKENRDIILTKLRVHRSKEMIVKTSCKHTEKKPNG